MNTTSELHLTAPIYSRDDGVLFSAYGMGRGYCAYVLSYDAVCERLGAGGQNEQQVLLAFKLNRQRIVRAIEPRDARQDGGRIVLDARDFE